MKKTILLIGMAVITIAIFSCKDTNSLSKGENIAESANLPINISHNDSIAIMEAFQSAKSDKKFIADLGLEEEKQFHFNNDLIKIFRGDLDGNGSEDALLFFSIEGRAGGNNWDAHYAAFLNQDHKWKYASQIDAGGNFGERIIFVEYIKNGEIWGNWEGNKDESLPEIPVAFVLKNEKLINIFTGLHKEENDEREYISINEIMNGHNISIPLTGNLKKYQTLLGKGKISTPNDQPECGTYFDEGISSYLSYPNLNFEINDKKEVAWIAAEMSNSSLKIQTDKGTITENTKMEQLKSIFYKPESWWIDKGEDGSETFIIPDGLDSDNHLKFLFDKNGKLFKVFLWMQC